MKGVKSEKYKHVYSYINNGKTEKWGYCFGFKGAMYSGTFEDERMSALKCDLKRIDLGIEPVNILKPKI